MLTLLLGSNVGNFDDDEAVAFLRRVREAGRAGDWLLLGADLVKPERDLVLAYDDPLGVTAAFNKNLLVRLNRELGAGFDLARFDHRAVWNDRHSRVEMHLVSRSPQQVAIPGAGIVASFAAGESIWTESSCKYTSGRHRVTRHGGGLRPARAMAGHRRGLCAEPVPVGTRVRRGRAWPVSGPPHVACATSEARVRHCQWPKA